MKRHVKVYFDYFDYGEQDFIPSEISGLRAVDIHHIIPKSRGGKDKIENLIALTREEHNKAHSNEYTKEYLFMIHKQFCDLHENT